MGRKKAAFKRKNATTLVYNPTFPVHMKTCRKHNSTRTVYHPLFPANDLAEVSSLPPFGAADNIPLLSIQDEITGLIPVPTKSNRDYSGRKEREVQAWLEQRPTFKQAAVEAKVPVSTTCYLCHEEESHYRCLDCLPVSLCYSCILQSHALQPLHLIAKWRPQSELYWPVDVPELCKLRVPDVIPPGLECSKSITLVDKKGRTHKKCTVVYASHFGTGDEGLMSALLKLGFWPLSPTSPKTAVSIELLSLLHCLTLECQTSAQGFVRAIEKYNSDSRKVTSHLKRILRGESLAEFRLHWHALELGPISLEPAFKSWCTACPACPKASDGGPLVLSMDGNFGLVHKSNSGKTYSTQSPMEDMYFLPQEKVDSFVDSYYQDTKDDTQECSQFQAAEAVRSKNQSANLTVTGVFGSSCRHEIPRSFMDLRHGERLAYPVMLLKEVREVLPANVKLKLLYDIACTMQNHLRKRNNEYLLEDVQLAIPVFHSYGHKGECQITMNPRRMDGFGLTDGEQLERLWSYLRLFSKITKEQTPGHRKELLTMALSNFAQKKMETLEQQLLDRYRRTDSTMLAASKSVSDELDQVSAYCPNLERDAILPKLKADEEDYLKYIKKRAKNTKGTWMQAYAKELLRFYTLNAQLHSGIVSLGDGDKVLQTTTQINLSSSKLKSLEKKHKFKRWSSTSQEYKDQLALLEDDRRKDLLSKLHSLLIEKQFLTEIRRRYSDGQAVASRICRQLKRVARSITISIKTYNTRSSEGSTSSLPAKLSAGDVCLTNDIFNDLHQQPGTLQVPVTMRRQLMDKNNLQTRCKEELEIIRLEMRNCYVYFCNLHACLAEYLAQLDRTTQYGKGLHSVGLLFIIKLEVRISRMWKWIKLYVPIPDPPEDYELHQNLHKEDIQIDTTEEDSKDDSSDDEEEEDDDDDTDDYEAEEYEDDPASDDDTCGPDMEFVFGS